MSKFVVFHWVISLFIILVFLAGCNITVTQQNPTPTPQVTNPPQSALVNKTVFIGAGGGYADLVFSATNGQRIRITLTATNSLMEPYGFLQYPDGTTSTYVPPLTTSMNGVNSTELILTQSGIYFFTVFDGSNLGGQVQVKIEVI